MKKNLLILLLAFSNLGMIVHLITCRHCSSQPQEAIVVEKDAAPINGKCFMQNLKFDREQKAKFRDINCRFRQNVGSILSRLGKQKENMFGELQQINSDTVKLRTFSRGIGELHRQLKDETIDFYLKIKVLCTDEQRQRLEDHFTPLFRNNCCQHPEDCTKENCPLCPSREICEP